MIDKKTQAFRQDKKLTVFVDPDGVSLAAFSDYPREKERLTLSNQVYKPITLSEAEEKFRCKLKVQAVQGRKRVKVDTVWVQQRLLGPKHFEQYPWDQPALPATTHEDLAIEKVLQQYTASAGQQKEINSIAGFFPVDGAASNASYKPLVRRFKENFNAPYWRYFQAFIADVKELAWDDSSELELQLQQAIKLGLLAMPQSVYDAISVKQQVIEQVSALSEAEAEQLLNSGYAHRMPAELASVVCKKINNFNDLRPSALAIVSSKVVYHKLSTVQKQNAVQAAQDCVAAGGMPITKQSDPEYVKQITTVQCIDVADARLAQYPLFHQLSTGKRQRVVDYWLGEVKGYCELCKPDWQITAEDKAQAQRVQQLFSSKTHAWLLGDLVHKTTPSDASEKQRLLQLLNDNAVQESMSSKHQKKCNDMLQSLINERPEACLELVSLPCNHYRSTIQQIVLNKCQENNGGSITEELAKLACHREVFSIFPDPAQQNVTTELNAVIRGSRRIRVVFGETSVKLNQHVKTSDTITQVGGKCHPSQRFIINNIAELCKENNFELHQTRLDDILQRIQRKEVGFPLGALLYLNRVKGFSVRDFYRVYKTQRKPLQENTMPILIACLQSLVEQLDSNDYQDTSRTSSISMLFAVTNDIMRQHYRDFNDQTKVSYAKMVMNLLQKMSDNNCLLQKQKVLAARLVRKISKHLSDTDKTSAKMEDIICGLCEKEDYGLLKTEKRAQDLYYTTFKKLIDSQDSPIRKPQQIAVLSRGIDTHALASEYTRHLPETKRMIVSAAKRAPQRLKSPLHQDVIGALSPLEKKRAIRAQLSKNPYEIDWPLVISLGEDKYLLSRIRKRVRADIFWSKNQPSHSLNSLYNANIDSSVKAGILSRLVTTLLKKSWFNKTKTKLLWQFLGKRILPQLSDKALTVMGQQCARVASGRGSALAFTDGEGGLFDFSSEVNQRQLRTLLDAYDRINPRRMNNRMLQALFDNVDVAPLLRNPSRDSLIEPLLAESQRAIPEGRSSHRFRSSSVSTISQHSHDTLSDAAVEGGLADIDIPPLNVGPGKRSRAKSMMSKAGREVIPSDDDGLSHPLLPACPRSQSESVRRHRSRSSFLSVDSQRRPENVWGIDDLVEGGDFVAGVKTNSEVRDASPLRAGSERSLSADFRVSEGDRVVLPSHRAQTAQIVKVLQAYYVDTKSDLQHYEQMYGVEVKQHVRAHTPLARTSFMSSHHPVDGSSSPSLSERPPRDMRDVHTEVVMPVCKKPVPESADSASKPNKALSVYFNKRGGIRHISGQKTMTNEGINALIRSLLAAGHKRLRIFSNEFEPSTLADIKMALLRNNIQAVDSERPRVVRPRMGC